VKINTNLEKEFNLTSIHDLDEFNLTPMSLDETEEVDDTPVALQTTGNTKTQLEKIDKIEAALPQVAGLDASDKELDELADYGVQAHKELMELAMNIEQRFAADVASAAGNMLGHAITAKTNKAKKNLDMITIQIKKQLADHKTKIAIVDPEDLDGAGQLLDRNEILDRLLKNGTQNREETSTNT